MELQNSDDEIITWETFRDFYADISMTIFNDHQFVKLLADTWSLPTSQYTVHAKDVETLLAAIRHNLMKLGSSRRSEEYILRDLYREFERNAAGTLCLEDLKAMLVKLNLRAEDKYLVALMSRFDSNQTGVVDFEEFAKFVCEDRYHKY